jgi:5-methylcytosine-specific restriction endonuclease McrA
MTERRSISPMRRLKIFEANGGRCHCCERLIRAGEKWDVSHDRPLALLGADDGDNIKVAHRACHKVQTETDMVQITKAKRQALKHRGIKRPTSFNRPPGFRFDWRAGRYIKETA